MKNEQMVSRNKEMFQKRDYHHIFASDDNELGKTPMVKHMVKQGARGKTWILT